LMTNDFDWLMKVAINKYFMRESDNK
jgi:hypothetical protein